MDYWWQGPGVQEFFERLGRNARVAVFDKRGTGRSDRNVQVPTFEERMDDIRAVMDAAGFSDAVVVGMSEGVPMSILFAASHPSRTRGLVLYGGEAKGTWSPDYPWESTKEQWEAYFARAPEFWGTKEWEEKLVSNLAPSRIGDARFTEWLGTMGRMGSSPGTSIALAKSEMNMDVRAILPAIHVPTLVVHVIGDRACDIGEGRYIASRIPGARIVELPGVDHMFYASERLVEAVAAEVEAFVADLRQNASADRVLTTVLFTDIVGSTKKAVEMGDAKWQGLLSAHERAVREAVAAFSGRVVKSTGDGFLTTFDGPTRGIRCACEIVRSAREIGIDVRVGVHTGECAVSPTDLSGIAVHIASRIMDEAPGGGVMVPETVRDLVYGSGISFKDTGEHLLKGIDDARRLYLVESAAS